MAYILSAAAIEATSLHDGNYVAVGKEVDGRLVGGFGVHGVANGVFAFSGAATQPQAIRRGDFIYMLDYLLNKSKARVMLAFTATDNFTAQKLLSRIGFMRSCITFNYFHQGDHAYMYQLDFDFAQALMLKLSR